MKSLWMLAAAASLCWALADDEEAKALPGGPGKDTVVKVCLECHGAYRFRQLRLTQDDWSNKVYDMVDQGAKGSEDELLAVVSYLTRNFGLESKVNMNTAPVQELNAVLGFTIEESRAVVAYRQDSRFNTWRDLLKVPGVDSQKVEAKKDVMAF
ncbi:MAG TPA: helix-hairpin-helix domain-containing protein [Bryobacteraceae bacterium]|nr:helix-hairpin-helix domain-containing protein [Bryobacteraceae bacterium]